MNFRAGADGIIRVQADYFPHRWRAREIAARIRTWDQAMSIIRWANELLAGKTIDDQEFISLRTIVNAVIESNDLSRKFP